MASIQNGTRSTHPIWLNNGLQARASVKKSGMTVTVKITTMNGKRGWPKGGEVQDRYISTLIASACQSRFSGGWCYQPGFADNPKYHYRKGEDRWTFKVYVNGKRISTPVTESIDSNRSVRRKNPKAAARKRALAKVRKVLTSEELAALGLS